MSVSSTMTLLDFRRPRPRVSLSVVDRDFDFHGPEARPPEPFDYSAGVGERIASRVQPLINPRGNHRIPPPACPPPSAPWNRWKQVRGPEPSARQQTSQRNQQVEARHALGHADPHAFDTCGQPSIAY
jgi:hypothetical protein